VEGIFGERVAERLFGLFGLFGLERKRRAYFGYWRLFGLKMAGQPTNA
jgi:hypothetical protein